MGGILADERVYLSEGPYSRGMDRDTRGRPGGRATGGVYMLPSRHIWTGARRRPLATAPDGVVFIGEVVRWDVTAFETLLDERGEAGA
jgi:hypothetical protein